MRAKILLTLLTTRTIFSHEIVVPAEPARLGSLSGCLSQLSTVMGDIKTSIAHHYSFSYDVKAAQDTINAGHTCLSSIGETRSQECRSSIFTFFHSAELEARELLGHHSISTAKRVLSDISKSAQNVQKNCS